VKEAARAEAARWLAAAREDLAASRHLAGGGFHAGACFHAQQAAEKAVKAVHYGRGARVVIGHSVRKLLEALQPSGFTGAMSAARELDLLYIPARYPNGLQSGTPGEAFGVEQSARAIELAGAIVDAASSEIDSATR
jgi:HEPN domain-containing protein